MIALITFSEMEGATVGHPYNPGARSSSAFCLQVLRGFFPAETRTIKKGGSFLFICQGQGLFAHCGTYKCEAPKKKMNVKKNKIIKSVDENFSKGGIQPTTPDYSGDH